MAEKKKSERLIGETARQRTVRLASRRVSSALKYIDLIGNLAGVNYQLTEDEKQRIIRVLGDSVSRVAKRYAGEKPLTTRFTL